MSCLPELAMTPHVLPPLPYDDAALQPWINEQSLRLHRELHRSRVEALNAAEAQLAAQHDSTDFTWIRHLQRLVAVRASEHLMHCLFWEIMGPNQGGAPRDALADQIRDDFGSFAAFKAQFGAAAASPETTEWIALVWQPAGERLAISTVDDYQLPYRWNVSVLLALDVSEHAYYLQYENRRGEYVHNWWNTVNWPRVAERFAAAAGPWVYTGGPNTARQPRHRRRDPNALSLCVDGLSQLPRRADDARRPR
jgi:Fe-Mn family superoxide dismutase